MRAFWKVLGFILKLLAIVTGVLFTIYMLNLDMKLVGWAYKWINKFHDRKDSERDVAF